MNQCVPSWEVEDNSGPSKIKYHSNSPQDVPSLDYEVAELTWENGQLAMHGLGVPRVVNKPSASWEKPGAGGTLESIVNQATCQQQLPLTKPAAAKEVEAPWFNLHQRAVGADSRRSAPVTVTMDALVPCNNSNLRHEGGEASAHVLDSTPAIGGGCSTRVGSCSGRVPRVGVSGCRSASESATCGGGQAMTVDTWEREMCGVGLTSTSLISPENTVSDQDYGKASPDDREYSISLHSMSQASDHRKGDDDEEVRRRDNGKSSLGTKRSRAAAIHNQSERKRRDKINQRMKTLQKMVPNSSKSDKASMLDEVIEYLKQLQAQVHMMNRMNMPTMMLPLAMQQQLQMSMMGMGMGMGMNMAGMGMGVMDINRPAGAPLMPPPSAAFMPVAAAAAPWDNGKECLPPATSAMPDHLAALLACPSQPMTMDAYSRLQAAMYQQMQQQSAFKN